jgi:hypothetical protein
MRSRQLDGLLPAVCNLLAVPGFAASACSDLPAGADHVVLLLVDGLGELQLAGHREVAPRMWGMRDLGPLRTPFPSTTAVSLTSLGTGLPPGKHGIVGTSFRLEDGTALAPLKWADSPNPIATQPEPTLFERAARAGVSVVSVAPEAYRSSGLTRAALRGGEFVGVSTAAQRVDVVVQALAQARSSASRSLTYVYWPDLDRAGHANGVASSQYRRALQEADALAGALAALCRPDVALLITSDHGLVDVPDSRRFDLEAHPALRGGVEVILGEPRARHVYVKRGMVEQVLTTWRSVLGPVADILPRRAAAELLGGLEDWFEDRVGDVVAIARDDWALVSDRVDRQVSALRGQHGGLTDAEVLVPLRLGRA